MMTPRKGGGSAISWRHGAVARSRHRRSRRKNVFRSRPIGGLEDGLSAALDDDALAGEAMLRRRMDGLSRAPGIHAAHPDISSSRCDEDLAPYLPNLCP
jgi:hypothetical protein